MRARLAIYYSKLTVELREINLRDKPTQMLTASPKGTVPVLMLPDGSVIDESLDIMRWAISQNDPKGWQDLEQASLSDSYSLIQQNDTQFKQALDRYKYADRHPEHSPAFYRDQATIFLSLLENRLVAHPFLLGEQESLADAAIFPFVRQLMKVDENWFYNESRLPKLAQWLAYYLKSPALETVLHRYETWTPDATPVFFPPNS